MDPSVLLPPEEPPRPSGARWRWRRSLAMVAALGLLAAACGSSESATGADGATAEETAATAETTAAVDSTPASEADLAEAAGAEATSEAEPEAPANAPDPAATVANYPQVDVVDLNSGETVDFASSVAGKGLPTLIWFYAPH